VDAGGWLESANLDWRNRYPAVKTLRRDARPECMVSMP
jgi:hypothetical protein